MRGAMFIGVLLVISSILSAFAVIVHILWPRVLIVNSGLSEAYRKELTGLTRNICNKVIYVTAALGLARFMIVGGVEANNLCQMLYGLVVAAVHFRAATLTVKFLKKEMHQVAETVNAK